MTNLHEDYRELIALRLYEELEGRDGVRLEQHLSGCAPCREYALALEAGLGACSQPTEDTDLPAGWRERLGEMTRPPGPRLLRPALTFAAGLAAGLAVMAFTPGPTQQIPPSGYATNAGTSRLLALVEGPPPLATGGGSLGMLGDQIGAQ